MATYYVDRSDVPSGTKLPRFLRCAVKDMETRATALVSDLSGDGQIGFYRDTWNGAFVGYAIKESGQTRFEPPVHQ